jgi:hypothetical protein
MALTKIQIISESSLIKNSQDLIYEIENMNLNSEDRLVSLMLKAYSPIFQYIKPIKSVGKWSNCISTEKAEVEDYIKSGEILFLKF